MRWKQFLTPVNSVTVEEAREYQKGCLDDHPYNEDEIKNMTVRHNKDFSIEALRKIAASYSLEDVIARHK